MATRVSLKQAIIEQRQRREAFDVADLVPLVEEGKGWEAVEALIFFASPAGFLSYADRIRQDLTIRFDTADQALQERYLRFLADLTLALRSFLPRWNLQDAHCHGGAALSDLRVEGEADRVQMLTVELAAQAPVAVERLLDQWWEEAAARFQAEDVANPDEEAEDLVGDSVGEYLANVGDAIARSNLRRIAEMRAAGQTPTELGNDYAAFLQYTLHLGISFATTNPPLVDMAWLADVERWNPVVDAIIRDHPGAGADELARWVTLEVVLTNMRLLRPIFLLTEGQMGCVCLQVNPRKHDDAQVMISDALFFYEQLRARMGGVPNVVFKLPSTAAGLEACRALTGQGIGVTITVNFGLFQHLPFAKAMAEGQAITSCLVEMNGRLAYPVRDELLAKLDELAAYGIDEARAREAAAWAGVAVIKRVYRLLAEKSYDMGRFKPLIASLRIYEGDGYESLPSAFPDVTEVLGASIISVFPNVRRAFDERGGMELDPMRIEEPVPGDVLEVLAHSEVFKQAYYVADRDWVPEEDGRFRPDYELTLGDKTGTFDWVPVNDTLVGFIASYDTFVERILERKRLLQV